jgi:serine/threonine protein kinase
MKPQLDHILHHALLYHDYTYTLHAHLHTLPEKFNWSTVMQPIIEALDFCHNLSLVHCNITTHSVFYAKDKWMLGNFEHATLCGGDMEVRHVRNVSPEAAVGQQDGMVRAQFPLDVWGCGRLLYDMLYPSTPFWPSAYTDLQIWASLCTNTLTWTEAMDVCAPTTDLLKKLLHWDPYQRGSLQDIMDELCLTSAHTQVDHYQLLRSKGKDSYKAQDTDTNLVCFIRNYSSDLEFTSEVETLKLVRHPNVVELLDVVDLPNAVGYIVFACGNHSLKDFIHFSRHDMHHEVRRIMLDVLCGIEACHAYDMAHCNINPENIVYFYESVDKAEWKLTGFRNARPFHTKMHVSVRSQFMAPECIPSNQITVTDKLDSYAFAQVLLLMLNSSRQRISDEWKPSVVAELDPNAVELIDALSERQPDQRLALSHASVYLIVTLTGVETSLFRADLQ